MQRQPEHEIEAARRAQDRVRELDRVWELTRRLNAMSGLSQSSRSAQTDLERVAVAVAA
jgi:hypothetical protein